MLDWKHLSSSKYLACPCFPPPIAQRWAERELRALAEQMTQVCYLEPDIDSLKSPSLLLLPVCPPHPTWLHWSDTDCQQPGESRCLIQIFV